MSAIRRITVEQAISELRQRIRHMELIYEMPSARMVEILKTDPSRETAEVCFWMLDYIRLQGLLQR